MHTTAEHNNILRSWTVLWVSCFFRRFPSSAPSPNKKRCKEGNLGGRHIHSFVNLVGEPHCNGPWMSLTEVGIMLSYSNTSFPSKRSELLGSSWCLLSLWVTKNQSKQIRHISWSLGREERCMRTNRWRKTDIYGAKVVSSLIIRSHELKEWWLSKIRWIHWICICAN